MKIKGGGQNGVRRLKWGKEEGGAKQLKGEGEVRLPGGERERKSEAIVDRVHTEKQRYK